MVNVNIENIVGSVIAIVIGVSLIGTITTSVSDANLSGTNATLGNLIPIVFIAGLVLTAVYAFMKK